MMGLFIRRVFAVISIAALFSMSSVPAFAVSAGLSADVLFSLVNNYRAGLGLPPFQKSQATCDLAASRAPEIYNEIYITHTMHAGMYARHLPYWNSENIIYMNSEQAAFTWWKNDYIHRVQMQGNYVFSCVACSGNACVQEFTNFTPKNN